MLENFQIGVLMTLMFRIEIVGKGLHPIYLDLKQLLKNYIKKIYFFLRLLLSSEKDTIKIEKHQLQIE